jgi:hypothetical protein
VSWRIFCVTWINRILRGELDLKIGYTIGYLTTLHTKALFEADCEEQVLRNSGS